MAIHEVISELKQPVQKVSQPKSKKKIIEKKEFTKNSVLNDVLNETAQGEEWKTMGGGVYDSSKVNEVVGNSYGDMMNETQQVSSNDPMAQFLNKDYSQVLQKSVEKSKQKRGAF
tara:strand:- start:286 stop:630 length:345 start_codon:yes stop_codon:yes gene_type:complete